MAQGSDVKLGQLTRYIFTAPNWKRSLVTHRSPWPDH